ncbi:MAG: MFS transporter [Pseudomonadota bacterium]
MREPVSQHTSSADSFSFKSGALAAMIAVACIVEVVIYLGPFFINSMVNRFAVEQGSAGFVVSVELVALALASGILAKRVLDVPARKVAFFSLLLAATANLLSFHVADFSVFVVTRMVAGIGGGCALAIATSMATRAANPHKVYATVTFMAIMAAVILFSSIPPAVPLLGSGAVYLCLAGLTFLVVAVTVWFPDWHETETKSEKVTGPETSRRLERYDALILLSIGGMYLAQAMVWPYVERIGDSIDLSMQTIGTVLSVTALISLLGPATAHYLNDRLGLLAPTLTALGLQLIATLCLALSHSLFYYSVSAVLMTTAFTFAVPYLKGLVARSARAPRLASTSIALVTLCGALGPGVSGMVLNLGGNYTVIGFLSVAVFLAAMYAAKAAVRELD